MKASIRYEEKGFTNVGDAFVCLGILTYLTSNAKKPHFGRIKGLTSTHCTKDILSAE